MLSTTRTDLWDSTCTSHILSLYAVIVSLHEVIRAFSHEIEAFSIKCEVMRISNGSTASTTVHLCAWPLSAITSAAKIKDNWSVLYLETRNDEMDNTIITDKSIRSFTGHSLLYIFHRLLLTHSLQENSNLPTSHE